MMRDGYYILDADHNLIHTDDVHEWGRFFEDTEKRRVALTKVGEAEVSTVFLGIDHNFGLDGPDPLLFETMIFGNPLEGETWRYSTWDQAQAGHDHAVKLLTRAVRRVSTAIEAVAAQRRELLLKGEP